MPCAREFDGLLLKPFEKADELLVSVKQALEDRQKKVDAARIQTLRPLFTVTESLLSETDPSSLLELVLDAICGHLSCDQAAYYELDLQQHELEFLGGRGIFPFEVETSFPVRAGSAGKQSRNPIVDKCDRSR